MKKSLLYAVCFALAAILFVGCNPTDGDGDSTVVTKISGKIESMPSGTGYTVRLYNAIDGEYMGDSFPVGADGSFSIDLPASFTGSVMVSVDEILEFLSEFVGADLYSALTITNGSALMTSPAPPPAICIELFQDDEYVDDIVYGYYTSTSAKTTEVSGNLCYFADNASATGSISESNETIIIELNCKKGWNWVFFSYEETSNGATMKYTSKAPAGLVFMLEDDAPFRR